MTISQQLKTAIKRSGESCYAISRATGIDKAALSRFMAGKRGLTSGSIDKLARYLGLKFTSKKGGPEATF
jgi:plasmid maintenance system antidote protein VapI